MFTGIVQTKAQVISHQIHQSLLKLRIALSLEFIQGLEQGASVANNGVCLTAVNFGELSSEDYPEQPAGQGFIDFDVIDETLRLTNLGQLTVGDHINIERSLKVGDEIGGHMVSGHVQYMATIADIQKTETNCAIYIENPEQWLKYILPKGFITVNGTSLTVGKVSDNQFSIHLIPETLERTNLGELKVGDKVNIELDQQTVTIVDTIKRMKLSLTD